MKIVDLVDIEDTYTTSTVVGRVKWKESVVGFGHRMFDIIGALVGIVILLPIFLFVLGINFLNRDFNSVIFSQKRIGKNGKSFKMYKFRTMVVDAEGLLEEYLKTDKRIRKEYLRHKKLKNDPRITEAGKFLRKTSLDEFPQFINVLKGDMSLVGPRPYLIREKEDMGTYYEDIIRVKPGVTGLWQVSGRSDVGFKDRIKMDSEYAQSRKFNSDIEILFKTVNKVFKKEGAL